MTCNTRKGTLGRLRKLSSWISLRELRRVVRDGYIRFCAKIELLKTENYINTESVVSDQPAQIAQADLNRHFSQLSECPFSRVTSRLCES